MMSFKGNEGVISILIYTTNGLTKFLSAALSLLKIDILNLICLIFEKLNRFDTM